MCDPEAIIGTTAMGIGVGLLLAALFIRRRVPDQGAAREGFIIRTAAILRTCMCPCPANAAPDYITVDECLRRNECGCDLGDAVIEAGELTSAAIRTHDGMPT